MTAPLTVRVRRGRSHPLLWGGLGFLAVSLVLFGHVLVLSPSRAATCSCSDVSQFTWFIEWVWVAVRHLHDPFFSRAMFYPHGVNLLDNTSATGLGFLLLPVTALVGPVAALNVALVLAPVVTGVATMAVVRRVAPGAPIAAFAAALLYAFSPLVIFHSVLGHLNVVFLAIPPLLVLLGEDLLWCHRHRPTPVGLAMGALLVFQFFCSTEIFVMTLLLGVVGLVVLGLGARLDGGDVAGHLRRARRGLVAGGALLIVLLAGPAAFALLGPTHFAGAVWPGRVLSDASVRNFVTAASPLTLWWQKSHWHFLQPIYLAPGLLASVAIGLVVFRRDRRLWSYVVLALLAALLALGPHYSMAPWHLLGTLPLLQNVVNDRFGAFMILFLAIALAVVASRIRHRWPGTPGRLAVGLMLVVSLAPYVDDVVHVAPFAAQRVWIPRWYAENAATLPNGQVILGFPFFDASANLLAVQAIYGMHYSVVGGTTAQWLDSRQGVEAPGYKVIWNLASSRFGRDFPVVATPRQTEEVTSALTDWGVTLVVVPKVNGPTTAKVARAPSFVRTWLASVLGRPVVQSGAWVWQLREGTVSLPLRN